MIEERRVSETEIREYIATLNREEKSLLYAILKAREENPHLFDRQEVVKHEHC